MGCISSEQIRDMISVIKRRAVSPKIIKTEQEAEEATARDVTGHKWQVGDEYYELPLKEMI